MACWSPPAHGTRVSWKLLGGISFGQAEGNWGTGLGIPRPWRLNWFQGPSELLGTTKAFRIWAFWGGQGHWLEIGPRLTIGQGAKLGLEFNPGAWLPFPFEPALKPGNLSYPGPSRRDPSSGKLATGLG